MRRASSAIWCSSSRIRRPASTRAPSSKGGSTAATSRTTARSSPRRRTARAASRSYPHPQLMPDFWQFPTGSMGIGPINAIYQARFMRYLAHRGLLAQRRPPRLGLVRRRRDGRAGVASRALSLAAREQLDDLTFVINCNLQRLDGPVRGNGRMVDELGVAVRAAPAGTWSRCCGARDWDVLFARDHGHALAARVRRRSTASSRRSPFLVATIGPSGRTSTKSTAA